MTNSHLYKQLNMLLVVHVSQPVIDLFFAVPSYLSLQSQINMLLCACISACDWLFS